MMDLGSDHMSVMYGAGDLGPEILSWNSRVGEWGVPMADAP